MTSVTLNTRPQKRRRTEDPDNLFDEIVKNAHELLDASLTGHHGLSKSSNRIQDLHALREELEISKRLEAYFQDRVTHLTEQVENQEKIREDYRLLRLPKLPSEIILKTLSYFSSKHMLNLPGSNGLTVIASGVLPYLIIKPGLLLPPYCNNCSAEQTLDELSSSEWGPELELPILTDTDITRAVKIVVEIRKLPVSGSHADGLRLLLQVCDRWEELLICYKDATNIIPTIKFFSSCLPHISRLYIMPYNNLELTASLSTSNIALAAPSLKTVGVSAHILPALFNCGIINFISELVLDFNCYLRTDIYDPTNLVQILSKLPHLNTFTVDEYVYNPIDKARVAVPKVRSSSLQHVKIVGSDYSDLGDPGSLLALFQDCPVRSLDLNFLCCYMPEVLGPPSILFPGLKKIKITGEENLDFFSSLGPNGKVIFPRVEEFSFEGCIEFERLWELILQAVHSRSRTPNVTSIKCIYLCIWTLSSEDHNPTLLASLLRLKEELEEHVEKVECTLN